MEADDASRPSSYLPNDSRTEFAQRVGHWLAAGTRAVLVINPGLRNLTLYRSPTDIRILSGDDRLELPDLIPGWSIGVAEISKAA